MYFRKSQINIMTGIMTDLTLGVMPSVTLGVANGVTMDVAMGWISVPSTIGRGLQKGTRAQWGEGLAGDWRQVLQTLTTLSILIIKCV